MLGRMSEWQSAPMDAEQALLWYEDAVVMLLEHHQGDVTPTVTVSQPTHGLKSRTPFFGEGI